MNYTTVIGLEIHVQLKTNSKMFCRCSNEGELAPPNTTICPVCTGQPGTLPVLNDTAVQWGMKTALALHCEIPDVHKFDRKNYFYPDLPKGYQISQYDQPIGLAGYLDIEIDKQKNPSSRTQARIRIRRLHLEEDAAKLLHASEKGVTLVDFNRASTPLMEIVTEPDIRSPQEANVFLQELRLLVRYLGVSHADMEKGHLRCDANVSLEFDDNGVRVQTPISEIKNLNSFRSVERALEYEAARLYSDWQNNGEVRKRTYKITVGWDDVQGKTILQRWKEEAHDYRYFPEPDLPPLFATDEMRTTMRASIPELPQELRRRLMEQYGITKDEAVIVVEDKALASFFEKTTSELDEWLTSLGPTDEELQKKTYRLLAGWLINKLGGILAEKGKKISEVPLTPENFGQLIALISRNTVNSTTAASILAIMIETGGDPVQIMKEQNLEQVSDISILDKACDGVLESNPDAVENFKKGKITVIMFLVGQVMRELKGKGQPDLIREILEKKLRIH